MSDPETTTTPKTTTPKTKAKNILFILTAVFILLVTVSSSVFAQEVTNWECRVEGSNDGCKKTIKAPSGKRIVGVTAACNLEYGAVSNSELASVPANTIKVVKKSDSRWLHPNGYCYVNNTKIFRGRKSINGIDGITQVRVGCFEHDKNGGDCHIRGTLSLESGEGTASENLVSYGARLQAGIPTSGIVIYTHMVNTNVRNSHLKKVHVAGNASTRYVVQFLPRSGTRLDCGGTKGVIVEPGSSLEEAGLTKLFGNSRPSIPIFLNACKLARVTGQISVSDIPIQITYIRP